MTSQPGLQRIAIHILINISRYKGNQNMKFGQLLEYNTKSFLEILCAKYGGETIPRPIFKKLKFSVSLDQYFKVLCSLFLLCPKLALSKYMETKLC